MNPAEFPNIARSERDFWWYRGMRDILFGMLDPVAVRNAIALEAGCGTGYLAMCLAQRYGWKMIPLDVRVEGLEYARGYGLSHLVQGEVTALPFATGSFDALVSMDVLVHLRPGEELSALPEFARVLRPGGVLALRVAALDVLRSRHSQFIDEKQRFTKRRLVDRVVQAGFRIERAVYANALLLPAALLKFRLWEPLTGAQPSSGVDGASGGLDALFYASLRLEAGWIARGGSFPWGQSVVLIARKTG